LRWIGQRQKAGQTLPTGAVERSYTRVVRTSISRSVDQVDGERLGNTWSRT